MKRHARLQSIAENLDLAAARCPELRQALNADAAWLRSLKSPGPKKTAEPSELLEVRADQWCDIADAIAAGVPEDRALADAAKRTGLSDESIWNLWTLRGRDDVRRVLIERGRIAD